MAYMHDIDEEIREACLLMAKKSMVKVIKDYE